MVLYVLGMLPIVLYSFPGAYEFVFFFQIWSYMMHYIAIIAFKLAFRAHEKHVEARVEARRQDIWHSLKARNRERCRQTQLGRQLDWQRATKSLWN